MSLDFTKLGGLVPAIIQDAASGEVLMLGFMNAESFAATQASGEVTFFSRSRNKLWRKGEQERACASRSRDARGLRCRCFTDSRGCNRSGRLPRRLSLVFLPATLEGGRGRSRQRADI